MSRRKGEPAPIRPNVLRDGAMFVAQHVFERVTRNGAAHTLSIDSEGDVYLRAVCKDFGRIMPPDAHVGVYVKRNKLGEELELETVLADVVARTDELCDEP